ncbi:MAG TPA: HAD family hydrolase [Bacilli bacterium]|nr:HAD family hydrolase [Bacilli bacterium]HPS19176.1 HAD family hydrolase [Bacilli bacterium]
MILSSIKILFVDIDWTILDHHLHDWDYQSIDGLKKAQKNGLLIYLCTARPYDSIVHTGIFSLISPDGIICTNGGVAFIKDKLFFANVIPPELVREIEKISNRHHLVLELATDKKRYFTNKTNIWVNKYFSAYAETIPPVLRYQDEDVTSILLFAPEKYDEKLIKEYPSQMRYFRFDDYGVDICYHQNNKGLAIKKVLDYLHIRPEESMSFGDDHGDIPMFESTGISVAMGNGKPQVKESATFCTSDIGEHGVYLALEKYHLI